MNILIKLAALVIPASFVIAPFTAIAQTETQTDTQTTKIVAYRCTAGKAFRVRYGQNSAIVVIEDQTINMMRSQGADGSVRFVDETETYVLLPKGEEVALQKQGKVMFEKCTVIRAASATETESTTTSGQTSQTTVTKTTTVTVQRKPATTKPATTKPAAPASQGVQALW